MLSVGEVATLLNLGIYFVQFTLGMSLVLVLVSVLKNRNTAISWSAITRSLHSSFWPDVLATDSASRRGSDRRVTFFFRLSLICSILCTIAGIITPAGLNNGYKQREAVTVNTRYVRDDSWTGKATSSRDKYRSGRVCSGNGGWSNGACPGQNIDTARLPENITTKFSADHSSLTMQFRSFYNGYYSDIDNEETYSMGYLAQTDSFLLKDDIFAIEGAVVDMGERPGVGLLNHTFPDIKNDGAAWSRDVLWIEPITQCTNTNLTLEWVSINKPALPDNKTLVDHGGWYNLTEIYPVFDDYREGQSISLWQHTYKAAVGLNWIMALSRGILRNTSYEGYSVNLDTWNFTDPGQFKFVDFNAAFSLVENSTSFFNGTSASTYKTICRAFGGGDSVNITNVAVSCSYVIGPPNRVDHGDPNVQEANVTWYQPIHVCASTTRLLIQTLDFSYNGTDQTLSKLKIKRDPENIQRNVLWGMEKLSDWIISEIDPVFGRIYDQWENDPGLSTMRSDHFYVPAGAADYWGVMNLQASATFGTAWNNIHAGLASQSTWLGNEHIFQFGGAASFALMSKWQTYYLMDPTNAPARISNIIFSDMVANNLVATGYADRLTIIPTDKVIAYKLRYAIPAFLVLAIWTPLISCALYVLISRRVTFHYFRHLLNQTSVGRIVIGDSELRVVGEKLSKTKGHLDGQGTGSGDKSDTMTDERSHGQKPTNDSSMRTHEWIKTKGQNTVISLSDTTVEKVDTLLTTALHSAHKRYPPRSPSLERFTPGTDNVEDQWWNRNNNDNDNSA